MSTVIVGGGIAGAAAACLLGREAVVVEREEGPHHKVCGEFVSWEAREALVRLGVDPDALGGAAIGAVRLVRGRVAVQAALPGRAVGLSRLVLDEALLREAAARGAVVRRGRAVRRLLADGVELDGAERVPGARILLATGKHELPSARRDAAPGMLLGFKMHFRLAAEQAEALAGHVEVVLFAGGYAGLQPIEGGAANLCLLISRGAFGEAGGDWAGVLAYLRRGSRHLRLRLEGAEALLPRPAAIARIPYGFVHRAAASDPANVLRLGDQMAVIPSFSGDGMAIALHTAFAAVGAEGAGEHHRRMRADLRGQVGRAMLLHRAGQGVPAAVAAAARAWPGALAWVARLTRVPAARLSWR